MSVKEANYILQPEEWVDNYGDLLYAFVRSRVPTEETARDIVQETFLSAWKARDGYRGQASEKNWLVTICRNKIIDNYRKAASTLEQLGVGDYSKDYFSDEGHWTKETAPQDWQGVTYNSTIETHEFYKVLDECRSRLKELQQAVFTMKYFDDMDSDEICKVLNITTSNYWVLMHRAKLQLRDCLTVNWFAQ